MPLNRSLRTLLFRPGLLVAALPTAVLSLANGPLANSMAAERPTLNHTADPRPDILPHPLYYAHTEYRRAYNRPRYWGGWMADKIAANSQEAMVWRENVAAGRYNGKNCPPVYKTYYYPKPWEALLTGPRPDFPTATTNAMGLPAHGVGEVAVPESGIEIVPQPTDGTTPEVSSRRKNATE